MAETSTTSHEQIVSDYLSIWNNRNYEILPEVVTADIALYDPAAPEGEIHGRDNLETFLRELRQGFPDLHITIDDMITTDEGVIEEWTATGTHKGELHGLPPTHREIKFRGMGKILITEGKIREHRIYYDSQEMVEQLGLTFPEVLGQLPKLAWGKLQASI